MKERQKLTHLYLRHSEVTMFYREGQDVVSYDHKRKVFFTVKGGPAPTPEDLAAANLILLKEGRQ